MGRRSKPYWWDEKKAWYCTTNKVRHRLGDHPDGAARPKKNAKGDWNMPRVIEDAFHRVMGDPNSVVSSHTVWAIFDSFLDWTLANKAQRTYDFYRERLQRFKTAVPNMPVDRLTPDHVYQWLNDKAWSNNYKRGVITSLSRAFNFAVKARKIQFNPIKGIEKPAETHREEIITPEEFREVLSQVHDDAFRDILEIVWYTGCRPFEAARVTAKNLNEGFWLFSKKDSKGKKRERLVFLVDEALAICKKWAATYPDGPMFRNTKGQPWNAYAFNNRFVDLQIQCGKQVLEAQGFEVTEKAISQKVKTLKQHKIDHGTKKEKTAAELRSEARRKLVAAEAVKHARKICMYSIRHSYAHYGLTKGGVDPVSMAHLLGHTNTTMLMKVYGHLLKDTEFMRDAARRATAGASVAPASSSKKKKRHPDRGTDASHR